MKKGIKLEFLIREKFPFSSNRKFAELADIPPTTLQGIFNRGIETVSIQNAKKIAKALNMTVDELDERLSVGSEITGSVGVDLEIQGKEGSKFIEVKIPTPEKIQEKTDVHYRASKQYALKTIDYYGNVSAGVPQTAESVKNAEKVDLPKILLGKNHTRDDMFAVRVNGESMNKLIPNGSIAICIPVKSIEEVKNEDIVIFTKDNETSMKRFYSTERATIFSPESTMGCFYDVVVDENTTDEININAKVVSYHTFLD